MLTDTAIKALKPKDKLYKIVDRDGMYVVVQPSGSIVFRLDYRLNGRRETLTLGRYGPAGLSLARAREKLNDAKRAISTIKTIVEDPEVGAIYKGRVTRLMNFGAFVEIAPGKEGLVHISKLDDHRVEHVEDVVAVGDPIIVMVTDIDQQGRINLSRKDALAAIAKKRAEQQQ
mgnify:CR=1 FL=1